MNIAQVGQGLSSHFCNPFFRGMNGLVESHEKNPKQRLKNNIQSLTNQNNQT